MGASNVASQLSITLSPKDVEVHGLAMLIRQEHSQPVTSKAIATYYHLIINVLLTRLSPAPCTCYQFGMSGEQPKEQKADGKSHV